MGTTNFARYLTKYFMDYLIGERGVSSNTIRAYSNAFTLLLTYMKDKEDVPAQNLELKHLTKKTI